MRRSEHENLDNAKYDKDKDNNNSKRKTTGSDIWNLLLLAKPESRLLGYALTMLVVTSTVTMSLPLIVGKIIDNARPLEALSIEERVAQVGNSTFILGFTETQFYSAVAVLFAIGAVSNFGRMYVLRMAGEKLVARMRSRLFSKILSQDSYFFDVGPTKKGMKVGDLISRISSDTQIIARSLSGNISDGARAMISGAVGISMMCYVSWQLTLFMSIFFPPLIVMTFVYGGRMKQLARKVQENLGDLTKVTEEKLNGLKTIQSYARQNLVVHGYNKEVRNLFNTSMRENKLSAIYFSTNSLIGNMMIIGLLFVGTRLISLGNLTIGDLSSFMMYAAYTGGSVFGLGNFYTELMKAIGAADRVFELTRSEPKIKTTIGKKVDDLEGDIEFKKIEFSYPSRPKSKVFRSSNLNLTIKKGENVCFVGPSGSGKSTIAQLLLRFYDPNKGSILINGHDIKDLNLNFYRSKIGYVQQEPLLFSGTLRENITFGKDHCTEQEIETAIRLSNAYGFINMFPKGLDTLVGPSSSGAQLSGGQKQRISLARTLIKNPHILVLDEATSALDSISEELVMRNLKRVTAENGYTMISIAHRLSTIKNSDRIIVLSEQGEIVEDGPFTQLYQDKQSRFNELLRKHDHDLTEVFES
ncbi:hypothetical protein CANTEDRAFT_102685 [Yamadazyma tenuis ATCC 10573]|uniref:Uncharacterized protein n=1 Tax=Candida tenuis (strain ATCC 10573 / BCRC 21748 / CBS 615 / JCM 9827 / NBRC 10315 / NRRL Y-1498 / VKM Y-70) TaxID=590646 RepID=G3B0N7_CANTC|nr:uncharacterized protein CANTEDRAFT_102685 [Yamadazyma tenuis ATCC 10573]EGV65436.1 hypothetical protein CANTEDRAFT_102685 [Yamadazyma tenuis ATCC 10573]